MAGNGLGNSGGHSRMESPGSCRHPWEAAVPSLFPGPSLHILHSSCFNSPPCSGLQVHPHHSQMTSPPALLRGPSHWPILTPSGLGAWLCHQESRARAHMCVYVCVCVRACMRARVCACTLRRVLFFVTLWTAARQAPPSVAFSRQEYWSGFLFPSPGGLPDRRAEPASLASPALAGGVFITNATREDLSSNLNSAPFTADGGPGTDPFLALLPPV